MNDLVRMLVLFRRKAQAVYAEGNTYFVMAAKAAVTLIVLLNVNAAFPYRAFLRGGLIVAAVSILCSILPWSFITVFGLLFLLGQLSAFSLEAAVFVLVLAIALAVLSYVTLPGMSVIWALLPVLFVWKIPLAVPILAGLFGGVTAFVSVGSGTVIYFVLKLIAQNRAVLSGAETVTAAGREAATLVQRLLLLVEGFLKNEEMLIVLIVFCLTALLVHLLSRAEVDYAHVLAAGVGSIFAPVLLAVAFRRASVVIPHAALTLVLNALVALLISLAVVFFAVGLDYSRTEKVQFEDDDYYYFVKAVPKMKLPEEKARAEAAAKQQSLKQSAKQEKGR